jgi:4-amino-4-deoxy-L-arabinose transferase-like glycosyltransferase
MSRNSIKAWKKESLLLLGLALLSALLYLHHLGERSLWGSEGRWAEIAREMHDQSDYLTPRINGTPYRDKPLLSYYMITALTPLTGGEVTETTARLPSALAAVAAVFLLYSLGKKLYDRETGLAASLILATSFFLVYWGRAASADVITMTGVLLSLRIFLAYEESKNPIWLYLFFLSMACNSLTKGLLGFALPLVVLLPYLWVGKKWNCLANRHLLPAGIFALVLYLLPFLVDTTQGGTGRSLYLVFKENVIRFFAPFDHKEPIYYYLYEIFLIFAPWAFFLPGALWHHLRKKPLGSTGWFTLLYFVALFAFFTLSGSRRSYYLIPLFPAAALLVGRMWIDLTRRPERRGRAFVKVYLPAGILCLLFVSAAAVLLLRPPAIRPYESFALGRHGITALFLAAGLLLSIFLFSQRKGRLSFAVFLLVISCADLYYNETLVPEMETFRGLRSFCGEINEMKLPRERLAVLHQWRQGNLYFYLEKIPIRRIEDPAKAEQFLSDSENRLIVEEKDLKTIGRPTSYKVLLREARPSFEKRDPERFLLISGKNE